MHPECLEFACILILLPSTTFRECQPLITYQRTSCRRQEEYIRAGTSRDSSHHFCHSWFQCELPSDLNSLRRQRGQYLKQGVNDLLGGPTGAFRGARTSPTIALSQYQTSFARETSHSVCSNLNTLLESKHIRHHGRQEIWAGPSEGRRYEPRSLLVTSHHRILLCRSPPSPPHP